MSLSQYCVIDLFSRRRSLRARWFTGWIFEFSIICEMTFENFCFWILGFIVADLLFNDLSSHFKIIALNHVYISLCLFLWYKQGWKSVLLGFTFKIQVCGKYNGNRLKSIFYPIYLKVKIVIIKYEDMIMRVWE